MNNGRAPVFIFQQISFCFQFTEFGTIGRNIGSHPQHHLESHPVQLVSHPFRIRKPLGFEVKVTIISLPVIIYHKHPLRKSVLHSFMGIIHNVFLILIIHQLNPGIILRKRKESRFRNLSRRWKMLSRCSQQSLFQRSSGLHRLYLFRV